MQNDADSLQTAPANPLSFDVLSNAVATAAAIRIITELQPIGGTGDKICPATYENSSYAEETRHVGDRTVLIDSVQSQANRMELALLAAVQRGDIEIPLLAADFTEWFPVGRITALEAPHRVYDAIFRDSLDEKGIRFREGVGQELYAASLRNATPLLQLCPTALIFGAWDSTSLKPGYKGPRFERALVSEIVGFDAIKGKKTRSRIDPLSIELLAPIYKSGDWWTADESKADGNADKPVLYPAKDKDKPGRASLINHGNVTPAIEEGGYNISHAKQTTVLSLIALRRLQFPVGKSEHNVATDHAVQTLLAALGLCAIACQREEGYDLRSRCVLVPTGAAHWELVGSDATRIRPFALDAAGAVALFREAVANLPRMLGWKPGEIALTPSDDVLRSVRVSRELDTGEGRPN
jgi:CRISPR-associated protein Csb1